MKSKTVNHGIYELTLEIKLIGISTEFIETLSEIDGVSDVSLINYNGEFAQ
jgi:hypothetical protein